MILDPHLDLTSWMSKHHPNRCCYSKSQCRCCFVHYGKDFATALFSPLAGGFPAPPIDSLDESRGFLASPAVSGSVVFRFVISSFFQRFA
ncbi:hypothetical protein NL676_018259 [Syzygium grande]|nr:hypothetical protein NL676_018259 [Syzygium grande]